MYILAFPHKTSDFFAVTIFLLIYKNIATNLGQIHRPQMCMCLLLISKCLHASTQQGNLLIVSILALSSIFCSVSSTASHCPLCSCRLLYSDGPQSELLK